MAKRDAGGLGIGSLVSFNMALILKWQWRFFNTPDASWVRLLKIFYGRNGGFFAPSRKAVGGSPWSRILATSNKLHRVDVVPHSTMRWKIGNRENTCFWEDCWIGDKPLSVRFPRLFALERDGRCTVADRWDACSRSQDTWVWDISSDGHFSVAETRRWIDDLVLPVGQLKNRWCALVPRKVNIFIWRLLLDQLPTRQRLSGQGFEIESIMCPLCGQAPEHLLHLFCRCEVARSIWDGVFRWLAVFLFGDLHPREVFAAMETCNLRSNQKKALEVVICAVWWIIWRYRNDVVHDNRKMIKWLILDYIKEFSFVWFRNRQSKLVLSWTDWLQNLLNAVMKKPIIVEIIISLKQDQDQTGVVGLVMVLVLCAWIPLLRVFCFLLWVSCFCHALVAAA
ncbi:hypothetical protein LXL04_004862 [Taraxacum kok-saghyz]